MGLFKRKVGFQLRLFLVAVACIWSVILSFAYLIYQQQTKFREEVLINNVSLALGNIIEALNNDAMDVQSYMNFIRRYVKDTTLDDISIGIYDRATGRLLYSIGEIRDDVPVDLEDQEEITLNDGSVARRMLNARMPNDEKIFYFSDRRTADGTQVVRAFLPDSREIENVLKIDSFFWVIILLVGCFGTVVAYIGTAHQAKNVKLLHDFAERAASDRDFVPMGDFPADEIGDISRQIVAIYNARMQEVARREKEHEMALEMTEEQNRMKRALTNNIGHELKTPVGIVRSYLDMIISDEEMPDDLRNNFLRKAKSNIERMVSILEDLSTMTRLEESGDNIPVKEMNFHTLVEAIADDVESSGTLGDMGIEYNVPEDAVIMGNEGLLSSMLYNLIKNAKAYSHGTRIQIGMLGRNDSAYTFFFNDDGVGVEEQHIPHLFDRFYRIDTGRSRKAGGTGLGLAIAKSAVNTLGGSIIVRIRKGGGLEFVFTLPRPGHEHDAAEAVQQKA